MGIKNEGACYPEINCGSFVVRACEVSCSIMWTKGIKYVHKSTTVSSLEIGCPVKYIKRKG